jgi:peptidoglycan/xylan/chitin deacetylase (PgdA/CDA1 family)
MPRLIAPYIIPWLLRWGRQRHPERLWHLPGHPPAVALTFDDGPSRFTPALLDVLAAENVRASFFLLGDRCRRHPDVVRRIHADGHHLALHGDRHVDFRKLTRAQVNASWENNRTAILNSLTTPVSLTHFRPPFGLLSASTQSAAHEAGLKVVLLSSLPGRHVLWPPGWEEPPSLMAQRVHREATPGSIIVLHDGETGETPDGVHDQPQAAATARAVIHAVRERSLGFRTLAASCP